MKQRPLGSADDLGDDWWMNAESSESSKSKKRAKKATQELGVSESTEEEPTKKRKHKAGNEGDEAESTDGGVGKAKRKMDSATPAGSGSETAGGVKQAGKPVAVTSSPVVSRAEVTAEIRTQLSSCGRVEVDESDVTFPEKNALAPALPADESVTFSRYLQAAIPDWSAELSKLKKRKYGRPLLLVVTSSAVRAVDLIRASSSFPVGSQVAKLFAKHFKLAEHQEFLRSTIVHVGVGTPNRIMKLIESEHLSLKRLKFVVVDWKLKDAKQRQIFQNPEVVEDLVSLVRTVLMPRLVSGKTKIGLF